MKVSYERPSLRVYKLNSCQTLCNLSDKGEGWDTIETGEDNAPPLVREYSSGLDWDEEW
jgi:hypothetical protein